MNLSLLVWLLVCLLLTLLYSFNSSCCGYSIGLSEYSYDYLISSTGLKGSLIAFGDYNSPLFCMPGFYTLWKIRWAISPPLKNELFLCPWFDRTKICYPLEIPLFSLSNFPWLLASLILSKGAYYSGYLVLSGAIEILPLILFFLLFEFFLERRIFYIFSDSRLHFGLRERCPLLFGVLGSPETIG